MRPNGYILHQDKQRIVIATGFTRRSENAKTGDMIQVWILVRKENPIEALASGKNALVCGNCALQGILGQDRTCYVNLGQAPLAVWKAFNRGNYPLLTDYSLFAGRTVRLGSYGDPVFVPFAIIQRITAACAGWTGYTHQWRNPLFASYKAYVMASVETIEGQQQAQDMGWRTFRVSQTLADLGASEIVCPNTTHGISCTDCKLCSGTAKGTAKSILIEAHGAGKSHLATVVNN